MDNVLILLVSSVLQTLRIFQLTVSKWRLLQLPNILKTISFTKPLLTLKKISFLIIY